MTGFPLAVVSINGNKVAGMSKRDFASTVRAATESMVLELEGRDPTQSSRESIACGIAR